MPILRIADILECKHAIGIIVCLYTRGVMSKTDLYHTVSTNPRMPMKVEFLIEQGIVDSSTRGRRTELHLTEAGLSIAEGLCLMEEELFGSGSIQVAEGTCFIEEELDGTARIQDRI